MKDRKYKIMPVIEMLKVAKWEPNFSEIARAIGVSHPTAKSVVDEIMENSTVSLQMDVSDAYLKYAAAKDDALEERRKVEAQKERALERAKGRAQKKAKKAGKR